MSKRSKRTKRREAPQVAPRFPNNIEPKTKSRADLYWDRLTKVCGGLAAIFAVIRQLLLFW